MTKRPNEVTDRKKRTRVVVVGGGIGGMVAALELAAAGCEVELLERATSLGGKIRQVELAGHRIDAGPTVLTMRPVFEQIFSDVGARLCERLELTKPRVLARHFWEDGACLDLHSDARRSAEDIAAFAGPREARGFAEYLRYCERVWGHAQDTFLSAASPSIIEIAKAGRARGVGAIFGVDPFRRMMKVIGRYFKDPRLRRLFGRYATYYGCSPFRAPATLNLIAHVEMAGVWLVSGGMVALARVLEEMLDEFGVHVRCGEQVEHIAVDGNKVRGVVLGSGPTTSCDAVIWNGDAAALAGCLLPQKRSRLPSGMPVQKRSLSALTAARVVRTESVSLREHNVFFSSSSYAEEFEDIFGEGRLPRTPTVYVRAQDRDAPHDPTKDSERLFMIINAPARGDVETLPEGEIERCLEAADGLLCSCGLGVMDLAPPHVTTPSMFERRYPRSGGALYGAATHSPFAALSRHGARSTLPGLYLAGGSVHPGAGVPMSAMSGRRAASAILSDHGSIGLSPTTVTCGGTSTD